MRGPIVIGGNGHSGTRVFCNLVTLGGVFTGIEHVTRRSDSADLRIISLLNRWVEPYLFDQLSANDLERMRAAFRRRLLLYFPIRSIKWGFKNPRTMLILPFLDQILKDMKFIHVIRDGRDVSLGNPFVTNNRYVPAFLASEERGLCPEEQMILFWGRSNQAAAEYGNQNMKDRYLQIRWEDLCREPLRQTEEICRFAECSKGNISELARVVRTPASLGRWKTYPDPQRRKVEETGRQWLQQFGYV
ncbi:MAG: sulfotransferase [Gammaproteobacteria bacterium]|nr:MAG: sulfotransferase [Gammaproteobacteria bacterium]